MRATSYNQGLPELQLSKAPSTEHFFDSPNPNKPLFGFLRNRKRFTYLSGPWPDVAIRSWLKGSSGRILGVWTNRHFTRPLNPIPSGVLEGTGSGGFIEYLGHVCPDSEKVSTKLRLLLCKFADSRSFFQVPMARYRYSIWLRCFKPQKCARHTRPKRNWEIHK